jgi:hypothetical protein
MTSMPKFMLIAGGADVDKRIGNPKFAPVMFERYMAWIQGLRDSGRYVGSYKLYDQAGRRLTIRGGEVIDGPFIESKDAVGGIFIIEAVSLDEATEIARSCPSLDLQNGYMEVRVVEVAGEVRPATP